MNPVIIVTHNCLELTKRCIESARQQDIETFIWVLDNGSTDGTKEWLQGNDHWERPNLRWMGWETNMGVSFAWNYGLRNNGYFTDHCLVLNNDTIIPKSFYRRLLECEVQFVTGASVGEMIDGQVVETNLVPAPDFSAFLIRRSAWDRVGEFDESMKFYASDNDWHLRAHRQGVTLWNSSLPFFHERSSTLRLASRKDRREIELQADADRATFRAKWGFDTWSPQYAAAFSPETFGIDHPATQELRDQ